MRTAATPGAFDELSDDSDPEFPIVGLDDCREAYLSTLQLKGLQNGVRVARSRLKAGVISRAGGTYRRLGGRDWPLVECLLDRSCNKRRVPAANYAAEPLRAGLVT